jgi:hypothetical protein
MSSLFFYNFFSHRLQERNLQLAAELAVRSQELYRLQVRFRSAIRYRSDISNCSSYRWDPRKCTNPRSAPKISVSSSRSDPRRSTSCRSGSSDFRKSAGCMSDHRSSTDCRLDPMNYARCMSDLRSSTDVQKRNFKSICVRVFDLRSCHLRLTLGRTPQYSFVLVCASQHTVDG